RRGSGLFSTACRKHFLGELLRFPVVTGFDVAPAEALGADLAEDPARHGTGLEGTFQHDLALVHAADERHDHMVLRPVPYRTPGADRGVMEPHREPPLAGNGHGPVAQFALRCNPYVEQRPAFQAPAEMPLTVDDALLAVIV